MPPATPSGIIRARRLSAGGKLAGLLPRMVSRGPDPCLYLSFDDGPVAGGTPVLLEVLARQRVHATFFFSGHSRTDPGLVKACHQAGHTIGSHGSRHLDAWRVSSSRAVADLQTGTRILEDILRTAVTLVRPPYGRIRWETWQWARRSGRSMVLWSLMPGDFGRHVDPENVAELTARLVRPRDIVVLHEGQPHSVETAQSVVTRLKAEGHLLAALTG